MSSVDIMGSDLKSHDVEAPRPTRASRRSLVAVGAAAIFHVAIGSLDAGQLVLVPLGHAMLLALLGWALAIVAGAAALEETHGRSWSGWVACGTGILGAAIIIFARAPSL
jgi:hypothetical protein